MKKRAAADAWNGDRTRLKDDRYLELRGVAQFAGATSTLQAGNRSESSELDHRGINQEEMLQNPGIVRTIEYNVESQNRV